MRPRLAFAGLGWIGRARLEAVVEAGTADVAALVDPDSGARATAAALAPGARHAATTRELSARDIDGVVIATPSALHAGEAVASLERGWAVFCQKPLARTMEETAAVLGAARAADRLLDVDLCYRDTSAVRAMHEELRRGAIGEVFAADLTFHNAYGPGQPWYYARETAGGGCTMDLGIHLLDLVHSLLGWSETRVVDSRLFKNSARWGPGDEGVEDFAHVTLEGPGGARARLACSWQAPAGADAEIRVELFGSRGGLRLRNVNGSFYDFVAERMDGRQTRILAEPPDPWGGRRIVAWTAALARGAGHAGSCDHLLETAALLDQVYVRAASDGSRSIAPPPAGTMLTHATG